MTDAPTVESPIVSQHVIDGAEAIRALNRRLSARDGEGYRASPEDLAAAVLSTVSDVEVESAHLYAVTLEDLDREAAVFSAAGGLSLKMHRGDWVDRGRPAHIWLTIQTALYAP